MKFAKPIFALAALGLLASGCTQFAVGNYMYKRTTAQDAPYQAPPIREKRKIGNPYVINGVRYYPLQSSEGYREKGIASWYGKDFHGKKTANGERYNMYAVSAAHKTLPLPTWVRVTNLENGRSVVLRVNDRGPFVRGRIIDLSYGAAQALGTVESGVAPVLVEALPSDGSPLRVATEPRVTQEQRIASTAQPTQQQRPAPKTSFTYRVTQEEEAAKQQPAQPVITKPALEEEALPSASEQQRHATVAPKVHKFSRVEIYVQTGAFGSEANAVRQANALKSYYSNIVRQTIERDGRTLERVRVGPFETVEEADAALARLVEAGFNTAIIVVENR